MAKWADYGVSAVRYDNNDEHIELVHVHVDKGDTIATGSTRAVVDGDQLGLAVDTPEDKVRRTLFRTEDGVAARQIPQNRH